MATTTLARAVGKLQPVSTTFLLCDIQERFRDVIWHFPRVSWERGREDVEEGREKDEGKFCQKVRLRDAQAG